MQMIYPRIVQLLPCDAKWGVVDLSDEGTPQEEEWIEPVLCFALIEDQFPDTKDLFTYIAPISMTLSVKRGKEGMIPTICDGYEPTGDERLVLLNDQGEVVARRHPAYGPLRMANAEPKPFQPLNNLLFSGDASNKAEFIEKMKQCGADEHTAHQIYRWATRPVDEE